PGEMIDVVATERGIAINPLRKDLLDAVNGSKLPIRSIEDIKSEVEHICGGKPKRPKLGDRPVAVVKWVDGTVLDTVWQVGEASVTSSERISVSKRSFHELRLLLLIRCE